MDLNLDDLLSQGNIQYGNLLTTAEQQTITSQSYQQENMQRGDLLSTAVQSTITSQPYQNTTSTLDGSLLQTMRDDIVKSRLHFRRTKVDEQKYRDIMSTETV